MPDDPKPEPPHDPDLADRLAKVVEDWYQEDADVVKLAAVIRAALAREGVKTGD